MNQTWLDRTVIITLAVAIVFVAYSAASNHLLRKRVERLEAYRAAVESHRKAMDVWRQEKRAEQEARKVTLRYQAEVIERLNSLERCSCGSDD